MKFQLATALLTLSSLLSVSAGTSHRRSVKGKLYTGCSQPGMAAFTFDDGPYIYEATILKQLAAKRAKGTFFLNGNNWDCIYDQATSVKAAYAAGHLIASHTWTHVDITTVTDAQFNKELDLIETAFKKILGVKPKFFRPPYGSYNQHALDILAARGYVVLTWSWDSNDSDAKPPSAGGEIAEYKQLATTYKSTVPGPVALNHETYKQTSEILPAALKYMKAGGFDLVTVAECLGYGSDPKKWYNAFYTPSAPDHTWTCDGTLAPGDD